MRVWGRLIIAKAIKVAPKEVNIFAVKANEEMSKLILPNKRTLSNEAVFVEVLIEEALRTRFGFFAIANIFRDVRNKPMIEATFLATCTSNAASAWNKAPWIVKPKRLTALKDLARAALRLNVS